MYVLSVFFALFLLLNLLFMQNQHKLGTQAVTGEAVAISGNIQIYRNAVIRYARANSGVEGVAADTYLNLPAWFKRLPALHNYVVHGKAYVYYVAHQPELAYALAQASHNSIFIGIKRNGMLYHPLRGATSIHLPATIPENSVVYADG